MYGCEIVWPSPIGNATSSYARSRSSSGTNSSRGTRSIAASTRSSSTSRRWRSRGTREPLDAEVTKDGRGDVDDGRGHVLEADREHRHLRVAAQQRPVAAAARMVPSGQVGELDAGRGGDDDIPRVGVVHGGPRAGGAVWVVEQCAFAFDHHLLPVAAREDVLAFAEHHGL